MTAGRERDDAGPTGPEASRRDRGRVLWAVLRLDFWQEWYALPGAVSRAQRRELRSNLLAAAGDHGGVPAAVRRLGSLRDLARESVVDTGSTRWARGAVAAGQALLLVLGVQLVLSFVFADGLLAAGGGVGTLLGMEVSADSSGGALRASTDLGGWLLLAVPLVFVLVAKPWRLVRRAGA